MIGKDSDSAMHADKPMLEWHDLTVAYGRRPVLWNVDFEIPKPCLFGIIGPNGAGKARCSRQVWILSKELEGMSGSGDSHWLKLVRELRMCHRERQLTGIFQ